MFATQRMPLSFKQLSSVEIKQLHPVPGANPFMNMSSFIFTFTWSRCLWIWTGVLSNISAAGRPVSGASGTIGLVLPKKRHFSFPVQHPAVSHLWQPCIRCKARHWIDSDVVVTPSLKHHGQDDDDELTESIFVWVAYKSCALTVYIPSGQALHSAHLVLWFSLGTRSFIRSCFNKHEKQSQNTSSD